VSTCKNIGRKSEARRKRRFTARWIFMVRRDGAAIRKERIQEMARFIQRPLLNHRELSLSKTLAALQYEFGLRSEKIMEYLRILEDLGQFTLDIDRDKIKKISERDSDE
jgi:hypothetical protein